MWINHWRNKVTGEEQFAGGCETREQAESIANSYLIEYQKGNWEYLGTFEESKPQQPQQQFISQQKGGENRTMRTFEIGFNRVPCVKAQENGEVVETIVPVAANQVVAADQNAAIAVAAVAAAEKLKKVKGPELQVIVRAVA